MCRLCAERDGTAAHLVSQCKILCQTQYKKWNHDKIVQVIHWKLYKAYDLKKWYDHQPEKNVKILWDMRHFSFEKETKSCKILNVGCHFILELLRKRGKVDKYHNFKYELKRIWHYSGVAVIPVVICTLCIVIKDFQKWINKINPQICLGSLTKGLSPWNSESPKIRSEHLWLLVAT